ncbi:MAG: 6-carboxytetrahydropterin synthase QueD [Heliobacteriaceae bacterium]|nr:6-carboxytetrahydropterin synthase QueD [Heliobacteriaceae bacterium]MDD4587440.1 6-carboxytetrahydropterin synthase QueD [Heliobacteriaceae bacterium]
MYEVIVQSHFSAAHLLRGYPGKCARIHGHTWQVEVVLYGTALDQTGMLIDFFTVKQFLGQICDELDHGLINEHPYFTQYNPTAENIARYFYEKIAGWLVAQAPGIGVRSVQMWESPRASVRYAPDEREEIR